MKTDPMAALPPELKHNLTRYQAPPGLKRRIRYMLQQETAAATTPVAAAPPSRWRWWPLGASFACGALLAATLMAYHGPSREDDQLDQQVVASHVRSLQAAHLTDVASGDQHTVKPWFTGKLDYAPPVIDLAAQGFPLAGGRLDYLQGRPAAALVYRRRAHTINLFIVPSDDTPSSSTTQLVRQGWQVVGWTQDGMRLRAVSDVSPQELAAFATAFRAGR